MKDYELMYWRPYRVPFARRVLGLLLFAGVWTFITGLVLLVVVSARPLQSVIPEAQYIVPAVAGATVVAFAKYQADRYLIFAAKRGELAAVLLRIESASDQPKARRGEDLDRLYGELVAWIESSESAILFLVFVRGLRLYEGMHFLGILIDLLRRSGVEDALRIERCVKNARRCFDLDEWKTPASIIAYEATYPSMCRCQATGSVSET